METIQLCTSSYQGDTAANLYISSTPPQAAADSEDSEKSADDSGTDNEDTAGELETVGGGFGGIVMTSVQDTIAKARLTEAFMNAPTAGLSNNLDELAKLVEEEEEESKRLTTLFCDDNSKVKGCPKLVHVSLF